MKMWQRRRCWNIWIFYSDRRVKMGDPKGSTNIFTLRGMFLLLIILLNRSESYNAKLTTPHSPARLKPSVWRHLPKLVQLFSSFATKLFSPWPVENQLNFVTTPCAAPLQQRYRRVKCPYMSNNTKKIKICLFQKLVNNSTKCMRLWIYFQSFYIVKWLKWRQQLLDC